MIIHQKSSKLACFLHFLGLNVAVDESKKERRYLNRQMQFFQKGLNKFPETKVYNIVLSETINLIKKKVKHAEDIDKHSSLIDDLDLDSIEIMELIEHVRKEVRDKTGITLEPEIRVVGA